MPSYRHMHPRLSPAITRHCPSSSAHHPLSIYATIGPIVLRGICIFFVRAQMHRYVLCVKVPQDHPLTHSLITRSRTHSLTRPLTPTRPLTCALDRTAYGYSMEAFGKRVIGIGMFAVDMPATSDRKKTNYPGYLHRLHPPHLHFRTATVATTTPITSIASTTTARRSNQPAPSARSCTGTCSCGSSSMCCPAPHRCTAQEGWGTSLCRSRRTGWMAIELGFRQPDTTQVIRRKGGVRERTSLGK